MLDIAYRQNTPWEIIHNDYFWLKCWNCVLCSKLIRYVSSRQYLFNRILFKNIKLQRVLSLLCATRRRIRRATERQERGPRQITWLLTSNVTSPRRSLPLLHTWSPLPLHRHGRSAVQFSHCCRPGGSVARKPRFSITAPFRFLTFLIFPLKLYIEGINWFL